MSKKERSDSETPELEFVENRQNSELEKGVQQTEEGMQEPFQFTWNHVLTIIVLFSGYLGDRFLSNLIRVLYTMIVKEIGPSPDGQQWVLNISTTCGAFLAVVTGRASDIFGRKYIQVIGSILGIIGSIVSATTHSQRVLMAAAGFWGASIACHQVALSSIVEIFPRKYRAIVIGFFMFATIPADAFSPLIGVAFELHSSWRGMYWIAFGLYIFSLFGTLLFYHPEASVTQRSESLSRRLIHFDYFGSIFFLLVIFTIAMGLLFGGITFKWISVGTMVPTFLGVAFVPVMLCYFIFTPSRYPLFPKSFHERFWGFFFCFLIIGMSEATTAGMWPIQSQILYSNRDLLKAGLYNMAYGLAGCLFSPIAGFLFSPKYARWILSSYVAVLWIAVSSEAILGKDTSTASTVIAVFCGLMHGAVVVVKFAMVQLFIGHEDLGVATNLMFSATTFGGVAYGIVDQVIVMDRVKKWAIKLVVPALFKAGIPLGSLIEAVPAFLNGDITNPVFATANPAGLLAAGEAVKEVYIHTLRFVYLVAILFGGVGFILSLCQRSIHEPVTSRVDARLLEKPLRSLIPRRNRGF